MAKKNNEEFKRLMKEHNEKLKDKQLIIEKRRYIISGVFTKFNSNIIIWLVVLLLASYVYNYKEFVNGINYSFFLLVKQIYLFVSIFMLGLSVSALLFSQKELKNLKQVDKNELDILLFEKLRNISIIVILLFVLISTYKFLP